MNYYDFYVDMHDFFGRFVDVDLNIESNCECVMSVRISISGFHGNSYFCVKFIAVSLGELEMLATGKKQKENYNQILKFIWNFHKRVWNVQYNEECRTAIDSAYNVELSKCESKLAEKYLKVVRDSAILQSYEFNKITSDVLDRWQIEPLVRQKGGKAWVTEKKNIQKAS